MTKQLYEVPFHFKVAGTCVVAADSPEAAKEAANELITFDGSNVLESNVFFDEDNNAQINKLECVTADGETTVNAVFGDPTICEEDPADYGLEGEFEDEGAEVD
jgi:hypothetical protein